MNKFGSLVQSFGCTTAWWQVKPPTQSALLLLCLLSYIASSPYLLHIHALLYNLLCVEAYQRLQLMLCTTLKLVTAACDLKQMQLVCITAR